jgi:hypothetical protein
MTLSREEFLRSLSGALDGARYVVAGNTVRHADCGRSCHIRLTPLPDLRLGLLSLPRQRVAIALQGYTAAEAAAFIARLARYFHRGGG